MLCVYDGGGIAGGDGAWDCGGALEMFRCLGALGGVDAEEHCECALRHCYTLQPLVTSDRTFCTLNDSIMRK
jgi:hypothetical protein